MKKSFLILLSLPLIISSCTQLYPNQKTNNASTPLPSSVSTSKAYSGSFKDEKSIAYNYVRSIQKIIYANWNVPENSAHQTAKVVFSLDKSGNILDIVVNSNDENFKTSLIQALQKSSPLPPPPLEHYDTFKRMNFSFHAE